MRFKVGKISVDLLDGDRICSSLAERGPFEPKSLAAWAEMVKPGKVAIDVGAYTGLYSLSAAKLGAKVVAIEPIPALSRRFVLNMQENGCRNITLIKAAASDFNGEGEITFNKNLPFTAGASLVRKKGDKEAVTIISLDELHLSDVCAIKIDVERNEPAVLRGARKLLEKCRPMMLVECLTGMREMIMAELPDYKIVSVLDKRNLLLRPT